MMKKDNDIETRDDEVAELSALLQKKIDDFIADNTKANIAMGIIFNSLTNLISYYIVQILNLYAEHEKYNKKQLLSERDDIKKHLSIAIDEKIEAMIIAYGNKK